LERCLEVNTNKVVTNILQGSVVTQTVRWAISPVTNFV